MAEYWVRAFFVGLGLAIAYALIRFIAETTARYRKSNLYDLEQKEKQINETIRNLSDTDLLKSANDGLGISEGTDSNSKKE